MAVSRRRGTRSTVTRIVKELFAALRSLKHGGGKRWPVSSIVVVLDTPVQAGLESEEPAAAQELKYVNSGSENDLSRAQCGRPEPAGRGMLPGALRCVQENRYSYDNALYFDVAYGLLYRIPDVRYFGGVLRMSEAEKLRDVRCQESEGTDARAWVLKKPAKLWTVLGFGVMFSITVVAWVLYLVYSQGT
ncbi:hypothetical protein DFH09DRAFT_1314877 [Mycena vulgaris]|nr:hypothetical protein DFH09DRAFT_1314877 [Mycena vulgaris]